LTILQIVGSLIVAAGIPRMFEGDLSLIVVGYVVMRVTLVVQWLRAARYDPGRAITCRRYAVGIIFAQLCWVGLLFLPTSWQVWAFLLCVLIELAVPVFAESAGHTPWHPHHIAERYGLFFIIVLGEVILSTLTSIQQAFAASADSAEHSTPWAVLIVAVAGVGIVFSLWWLYFSRSSAPMLEREHDSAIKPFVWGFGHYLIFAGAAAVGAGLSARVDFWGHTEHVPALGSAALINGSVALVLAMIWFLHLRHHDQSWRTIVPFGGAIVALMATIVTPYPELFAAGICIVLLIIEIRLAGLVTTEE
jgi:low temperature requirement protein LtrA